ncbi:prepilin peptidase [Acidaminobacter sp. JC074]|uniref:prepilin peptidase n=1 Tax=Acidaminobacter sp. JC074 TaxID=2530199 RepID=UPI001F10C24E|nr:A24 family peptidase [Acidaminobacter sp. JC074]MCH4890444.1 prepilin peptidase [Acidaminobacter sp. JC074]
MATIQLLVIVITGIYISYIDFKEHIIPNKINIILFLFGILVTILDYENVFSHLLGLILLGGLMLILAAATKGFGMGDVKYIFNIGLIVGLRQGFNALLLGFMIGGVVSLILLALKKVNKKDMIAFGPYLVLGAVLSFFV